MFSPFFLPPTCVRHREQQQTTEEAKKYEANLSIFSHLLLFLNGMSSRTLCFIVVVFFCALLHPIPPLPPVDRNPKQSLSSARSAVKIAPDTSSFLPSVSLSRWDGGWRRSPGEGGEVCYRYRANRPNQTDVQRPLSRGSMSLR